MPEKREGVSLQAVVGGLLQAVTTAKHLGDVESGNLMEKYRTDPKLTSFRLPAFEIADVDVELPFAFVEPNETIPIGSPIPDIRVNISPLALKELPADRVSKLKLKITPVSVRVFQTENS